MIYIVTAGSYSDYGIHAAFTDKELAEAYCAAFKNSRYGDELRIEEYEENPHTEQLKQGGRAFIVRMDIDGNVLLIEIDDDHYLRTYKDNFVLQSYYYVPNSGAVRNDKREILHLEMHVLAKDEKHAIKIVNEKRGQLIATDLFKYELSRN